MISDVCFFTMIDPKDGETCQNSIRQKVKDRWNSLPCGKQALIILVLHKSEGVNRNLINLPLCRSCVVETTKSLLNLLE